MGWHKESMLGFDLETTGTDVGSDRIVTAAVVRSGPGEPVGAAEATLSWLLDPGVEIPAEATAIHGLSTADVRERGRPAAEGIAEIARALAGALGEGVPLVVMNARYDLTLLDRECRRHGVPTPTRLLGREPSPVIDPLVLDKHVDRYRKGKRTLPALCAMYGVALDDAHDAGADAMAAVEVARRMGEKYPDISGISTSRLHSLQEKAAVEQAESFERFLRRRGEADARVERAWPLIPYERTVTAEDGGR